jgi:DNA polymerase/3'-5' exonuclease PolX
MTKSTVSSIPADNGRTAPAPRSLADIPGLGPIRVRALAKAGWKSLSALRSANLAELAAVPGMTKIKARQIHEFLQPFSLEELIEAPAKDAVTKELEGEVVTASREAAPGTSQVVQRATRAMGEVITVLLSPEAPQFRSRLLRILAQFAQCAESIATDAPHLSEEQQAQAVRRLRRAVKSLSEITGSGAADRKAQGRVADAIEELTAKLAECRLSS